MIKVFTVNENGKIEFTKAELEKLLNDVYAEGQRNSNYGSPFTWTNPCSPWDATTTISNMKTVDASKMSAHVDKIIEKAASTNDVYSNLAKELNF